jgi:hypothetical protein
MPHDALIARLRATPQALRSLVRGRAEAVLTARDSDGGWTPLDVVAHVRASDAVLAPRVYALLTRDKPFLPSIDERALAQVTALAELPLDAQLAAFTITRAELTGVLGKLLHDQWARTGMREERGEISVLSICEWLASHEEEHVLQVRRLIEG